jgi:hypothetical protein
VAVLEGQLHPEVPFQAATDGVTGQRPRQLTAFGLAGRGYRVVGELAAAGLQVGRNLADHLPGVRQRPAYALDELAIGDVTDLGPLQQGGRDVQRHDFLPTFANGLVRIVLAGRR